MVFLLRKLFDLSGDLDHHSIEAIEAANEVPNGIILKRIPDKIQVHILRGPSCIAGDASHDNATLHSDMVGKGAFINRFQNDILTHTRFGIGL